jgi:hypothetical protein
VSYRIQSALVRFSDPRKAVLVITLLTLALALSGCGDVIPACPSGGTAGGCGAG